MRALLWIIGLFSYVFVGFIVTPISSVFANDIMARNRRNVQVTTSYPIIGLERRKLMNWNETFLKKTYEWSGRNRLIFLTKLIKDFETTFRTSDRWSRTTNQSSTVVDIRGRNSAQYLRPQSLNESKLNSIVDEHNNQRSKISPTADEMLKMSWDYELEAKAWEKTKTCVFKTTPQYKRVTSSYSGVGENLYVGWGLNESDFDPAEAVSSWMTEAKYFDPQLGICLGGECERYVQTIWYNAFKLGCAWSACDKMHVHGFPVAKAIFLACYYGPRGIRQPYLTYYRGPSCSFCHPDDKCENRLCDNSHRATVTGPLPWTTPAPLTPATTTEATTSAAMVTLIVILSLVGTTIVATVVLIIAARWMRGDKFAIIQFFQAFFNPTDAEQKESTAAERSDVTT
ncbi:uncharacterized protein LOC143470449 [Clavelina lepadiformis]|uniref:uncharacterized protein LOC143470449 n=1 Tax=Clavelina lepadiformis TaxID=159417 RepID=UPI004042BB8D